MYIECYDVVQLYSQRTYRLIVETQRLAHERSRVIAKRMNSPKQEEGEPEEVENQETKMKTLDLIKAIDQPFATINATLRPSVDILSPELGVVVNEKSDIFSTRSTSSTTCIGFSLD